MSRPKPIQQLMTSQMSRREFLGFMGVALLGVIGVTGLIRSLATAIDRIQKPGQRSSPYGSSPVGR